MQTHAGERKGFSDLGLQAIALGVWRMKFTVLAPVAWMSGPPIFEVFEIGKLIFGFPPGMAEAFLLFFAIGAATAFLPISEPGMGAKRQGAPWANIKK